MDELKQTTNNYLDLLNIDVLKIIEKHYLNDEEDKYVGENHHFLSIKIYHQDPKLAIEENRSVMLSDYYSEPALFDTEEDDTLDYWEKCIKNNQMDDFNSFMQNRNKTSYDTDDTDLPYDFY